MDINVESLFLVDDIECLNIIKEHRGCIFGGYLRDIIAGDTPNDIDCVVYDTEFSQVKEKLVSLGYYIQCQDQDVVRFNHKSRRSLDVCIDEYLENCILGSSADPDAEVNLLTYHNGKLYNWMDDTIVTIDEIINAIKTKTTFVFQNIAPNRLDKLINKGYKILGEINENGESIYY